MCNYCGRYFSQEAAERHIPICANVVNKPKPPPSARSPPSPARPPSHDARASPKKRRPSQSPGRGGAKEEEPGSHLPSVNSMRSTASAGSVGGSGARAARSLRTDGSEGRLPHVDSPGKGMKPRKEKITAHAGPELLDETNAPDSFTQHRLDAQRSALLLRLLRQVPQEALTQELKDFGVACEDLDKEGLVQSMVQQLS
ncbi:unnamed protein product [Effrenium voratum]|nr:unnamed protein product [Effrenium voratum]